MPVTYTTTTNITTTNITTTDPWMCWNADYQINCQTVSGSITYTAPIIWADWNNAYGESIVIDEKAIAAYNEQIRLEFEKRQKAQRETEERRAAAQKKAEELLLENLDAEQRKEFATNKRFTVHVRGKEDKHYLIEYGYAGNVKLLREGKAVAKFCIHPVVQCPNEDVMLAQKLLLETNEEQFLKIANKTVLAA